MDFVDTPVQTGVCIVCPMSVTFAMKALGVVASLRDRIRPFHDGHEQRLDLYELIGVRSELEMMPGKAIQYSILCMLSDPDSDEYCIYL